MLNFKRIRISAYLLGVGPPPVLYSFFRQVIRYYAINPYRFEQLEQHLQQRKIEKKQGNGERDTH